MKKLSIEVDEQTFQWLSQKAESEHRSVSGQVRFFLDQLCLTKADESGIQESEAVSE
jgi:hypothetical protein